MILASKRLVRHFLTQTVPYFATTSSRKSSEWSEVLSESLPSIKSYRDFQTLDELQRIALSALLDKNKSMVTVLGSPGTGKTLLVTEFVHSMCTKKQRVLVVCGCREILYSTVCRYFRRAKKFDHFVHLQPFDEKVALRIVPDIKRPSYSHYPAAREALAKRSLVEIIGKKETKRNGKTIEMLEVLQSQAARDQTQIVFATPDDVFKLLEHLSIKKKDDLSSPSHPSFDAVILEDIGALKKADDWRSFLQLAPLFRVVSDPHHSIALPPSDQSSSSDHEETPFQCSITQQIEPSEDETLIVLRKQYRGNMNMQIWSARTFYAPNNKEIDLARPAPQYLQHELRLNHLMDRLVLDERSVNTDTLTLVDTGALDGHWTESMFQPSEMVEWSDNSSSPPLVNWGEALLAAVHINSLLSYGIWPYQIACFTHSSAHGEAIRRILYSFTKSTAVVSSGCVEIGRVEHYLGRFFEAMVKSFITDDAFFNVFRSQRAMHYLSAEINASNRQMFLIGPLRRFRQQKQREAYDFVTLFYQRGSIITPSELFPLQKGQFEQIVQKAKNKKISSTPLKERNYGYKRTEQRPEKKYFADSLNNKNRRANGQSV